MMENDEVPETIEVDSLSGKDAVVAALGLGLLVAALVVGAAASGMLPDPDASTDGLQAFLFTPERIAVGIAWAVVWGAITFAVANQRGRSVEPWTATGAVFGPLAPLVLFLLPDATPPHPDRLK